MKNHQGRAIWGVSLWLAGAGLTGMAAAPANDAFGQRIALEGISATASGSNVSATRESGEPYHNDLPIGASVWWSWVASADGFVTVSTLGSTFDTVVAVYTGTAVSSLVQVAVNDDGHPDLTSKTTLRVEAGKTYQIAVDGYAEDNVVERGSVRLGLEFVTEYLAPTWTLKDVDGKSVSSTNYLGQVVLVNFWATWCGPCVSEMPGLVTLQEQYRDQGFAIVGISVDEAGPSVVRPFIPQHKLNYQIVMSDGKVERDFGGIQYIPTTFLIDRDGNLADKFVGYTSLEDFRARVLPLLGPETPPRLGWLARGGRTLMTWPAEFAGAILQVATTPTGPWMSSGIVGVSTNGQFEAEIQVVGSRGFYRLRR